MESNKTVAKNEISLKEFILQTKEWLGYLLTQWKIIVLVGLIGAVLGLGYSFMKKPVYTATLSFALEDDDSSGGGIGSIASSFGFDLNGGTGGAFTGANLNELFKSRSMVEKTLLHEVVYNNKKISLAELYIHINEWRDKWKDKPHLNNIQFLVNAKRADFTRVQDSVLGVIYTNLSKGNLSVLQKDKKVDITTVTVSSENEVFAKSFTENLATEVSAFYVTTKSKRAQNNLKILLHQTDSIRGALNGAISGVAVANDNTFGLNPAMNVKRIPTARKQVDVQANTAILTELVKQTELAKVTLRKETPLIQIIDGPIMPLENNKIGKLKGIVFGGIISGILIVLFLLLKRFFNVLMEI